MSSEKSTTRFDSPSNSTSTFWPSDRTSALHVDRIGFLALALAACATVTRGSVIRR
jgi:hypothetical protein